ncbi:MAG: sec-independent protein translocase protein TatC [Verrucomicrobiales bacterium]|jgi:sec-independent protein translocase protein TatC
MPFLDHIRELRKRIFYCFLAATAGFSLAYGFFEQYIHHFTDPFIAEYHEATRDVDWESLSPEEQKEVVKVGMKVDSIVEAFMVRFKASFLVGLVATFPIHLYHIIAFIVPALTGKEKKYFKFFLLGGIALALLGGYLAYFQVLELAVFFLAKFVPEGVATLLNYEKTIKFVFQLIFAFVVLFQIPLVLLILMAMNLVKRSTLLGGGRYFIVGIFVVSAVATPPDVVSQVMLSVPLVILFYVAIFVAKVMGFGEDDPEPDETEALVPAD